MVRSMKRLATTALALATVWASFAPAISPAQAFPLAELSGPAPADVVRVSGPGFGVNRGVWRNHWHGSRGYDGRGYYHHDYYRYHNHSDVGAVLGGLALGAIVAGALSQPRYYGGGSHADWCYSRYRSYRAYDNSYQPLHGPRRQCR